MPPAGVGTENWKVNSSSKTVWFATTTEAFVQNVYRAHFQIAQWYSALGVDPPPLSAVDYGWEVDKTNKCLIPRNMAEGVLYAPEQILKLVKCGCASQRPCKGGNCGCMGHQLPCTLFCACGGASACLNPFNTVDPDEAGYQDVDSDNDENVEDNGNDEEDIV